MRRILASKLLGPSLTLFATVCAVACAPAIETATAQQLLDPGWQLGYAPPSGYASGGGLLGQMFGDGGAVPGVAYQPVPMPYRPAPAPARMIYQQRSYAPAYYQPAPQARVSQSPLVYYRPAPTYYRQATVPQSRFVQAAPAYYRQAAMPQLRPRQPVAVAYQPAPAPAPRLQQPQAAQAAPQYTGSVQMAQNVPQPAPQPHRSFFQLTPYPEQVAVQPPPNVTPQYAPEPHRSFFQLTPPPQAAYVAPAYAPSEYGDMAHPIIDPRYDRQVVDYHGTEPPGTIVVDTPHFFLYLVMEGGKALRYGIGVGREGFTWSGTNEITAKREWPDWIPPTEMLQRRPDLPRYMAGGVDNPLGARALYIGSTLYRIHGSNEPWTIGTHVSSGCIRLRNADIIDLYERAKVGAKVVVL